MGEIVATRFLIISDTHELEMTEDTQYPLRHPTPRADVVLHCGDLTENGGFEDYKRAIRMVGSMNANLKVVIAGNHDISLDKRFYIKQGGKSAAHDRAVALWKSEFAKSMGVLYLEEGTHQTPLSNGALLTVYASPYSPQHGVSAFQYPSNQDRYSLKSPNTPDWAQAVGTEASIIPNIPIDVVMTHDPPKYVLDGCADRVSGGCEHVRRAICRVKPKMHCFGHIHQSWGAQRVLWKDRVPKPDLEAFNTMESDDRLVPMSPEFIGKNQAKRKGYATISNLDSATLGKQQTLFLNAAINDAENQPTNPPWFVNLDLPRREIGSKGDDEPYNIHNRQQGTKNLRQLLYQRKYDTEISPAE